MFEHIDDKVIVCTTCSEVMLYWQKDNHNSNGCN
jgi:hypothetical protein